MSSRKPEQILISQYYKGYFEASDRKWRRLGLRYTDIRAGLIDENHVIEVFEACSKDPVPSRLAALYLMWAQVQVFRSMAAKADSSLTPYTYGIHAEILYDRLTDRMLTKHKSVLTSSGSLSQKFTKAPVPWLLNVVRRTIKDSVYDMYRFEHDARAGREVRLRAPGRKVLMDRHLCNMAPPDINELSDAGGYTHENSPWAEMERLNTGVPLWES